MNTPAKHVHDFPMHFRIKGRKLVLRPLGPEDRDPMVDFARSLPEDDLLFLQRDITQPAQVERWIKHVGEETLVTILALENDEIVGYATFDRGTVRWTRHVAELRVVVSQSVRNLGIGRLLLELVFELALDEGVTKLVARMTPDQTGAQRLFKRLGFEEEAVLREHALGASGQTYDLLVLSFHTQKNQQLRCDSCGKPVLTALCLDGGRVCSHCFEEQYQELGGGG